MLFRSKEHNLETKQGHKKGAETLEKIVKYANKIGIQYMTVYAFSTENWKRTEEEIGALMLLLKNYLDNFFKKSDLENIKINVIGDISPLSQGLQTSIYKAIERTKNNTGLTFNIAFNYGGRSEIVRAVKLIAQQVQTNSIQINEITEDTITNNLYTKNQPDPELLIRTSGEIRTSNFLPWQIVYSEFYFPEKNWPEFNEDDFVEAIKVYQSRNRRFGGTK